jgi:small GTP-binding protein
LSVKKQGIAQLVIVGPPNIGKSSLLSKLSEIQIKVEDFDFTTLRPTPAIIKLYGNEIQLVEIPGLIEGASEGKGNGRALISVIRNADGIILMTDIAKSSESLKTVISELKKSGISTDKALVICNKIDLAAEDKISEFKKEFEGHNIIPVSVNASINLDILKQEIWKLTGMIKAYSKPAGKEKQFPPLALKKGSNVMDFVTEIHKDFAKNFAYARIWGESAKFPGQEVGLSHVLEDEDVIEVHLKR